MVVKENTVKARSMTIIHMPAVVQSNHPPKVFTDNTRDSSGINPEGEEQLIEPAAMCSKVASQKQLKL